MNLREQLEKEITDKVMTKLASERVELGLIDDYNKKLLGNESDKFVDAARNAVRDASKNYELASKYFTDLVSEGNEIIKKAEDLGATQAIKSVKNNQKMARQLAKDFARDASTLKKLG